jgi:hypothetical protein
LISLNLFLSSTPIGTSSSSTNHHRQKSAANSPASNPASELNNSSSTTNTAAAGGGNSNNNVDSMLRLSAGFDMMNQMAPTDLYNPAAAGLQAAALTAASQTWQYGYNQYPFTAYPSNMVDMAQFSGRIRFLLPALGIIPLPFPHDLLAFG